MDIYKEQAIMELAGEVTSMRTITGGTENRFACYDALWQAILAFEGETFTTMRGLEFTYQIKQKRNGEKSNEIAVSRKEKTITRSTVELSLDRVIELGGAVKGPKKLGTFGASYIYAIFSRFGLIDAER